MSNREDVHPRCDACDYQKIKKMESNPTVRELRDKIEQLSFRLTECKNENQMLKRNLQQAKKMVYKEVGATSLEFQEMLKHNPDFGRRQRMEAIVLLKNKVEELQDYLCQLEGTQSKREIQSSESIKMAHMEDKKDFWRIELERRKARETAEKDMVPLAEESSELRKRLNDEKTRFKELKEEVHLLRAQLDSQIDKNEEDLGLTQSFKTIESQLQETLAERAEIRRELVGSKARNKRLEDEISTLKGELQILHNKAQDNNMLIDSYTRKHKQIQEAIDAEKSISQQKMDIYKSELQILKDNYHADAAIMESLRNISVQRHQLISELKEDINSDFLKIKIPEESPIESETTNDQKDEESSSSSSDENGKSTKDESSEEDTTLVENSVKENEAELEKKQLLFDIAMYQRLLEASRIEKERLQYISQLQDRQTNEIATQVVETGRLVAKKDTERDNLREKILRMQRTLSSKNKTDKTLFSKNELEELRIKIEGQKEENEFFRNFLVTAINDRSEDFDLYKRFLYDTKQFFSDAFQDIVRDFSEKKPSNSLNEFPSYVDDE